ncbi:olfactory receptor 14A16-like [Sphaerodactylus townsendi]|uniref:olfactory receptor 14A16-like n=1 Tax=Sphaerodactylus townsendi TaxID=933632 RepID=UPI0020270AA9|nr:olfactory receptor 14A16-like [Sphaerodactylus townsendi]
MSNQSTVMEFLLKGFSDDPNGQIVHFGIFLSIYVIALSGNVLIISLVFLNHQLHTPMYFFLVNLSFSDICFISTTVPKSMATSLTNSKLISFYGCVAQIFLVVTFVSAELALLTIMAYDRYVAICHPLQYMLIMNWNTCSHLTSASWASSVIHAIIETGVTFSLNFCGSNIIEQFFCDIPQLHKISCMDTEANRVLILVLGFILDSFCIVFIFVSYGYIFSVVLKIPSVQGKYKAFSTCIPHLTVFSLFILTAVFSYMRPKALSSPTVDLLSAVLYAVLPPVLNPIIYSLRNKDIQEAVCKISKKLKAFL